MYRLLLQTYWIVTCPIYVWLALAPYSDNTVKCDIKSLSEMIGNTDAFESIRDLWALYADLIKKP